jgi:hypothetical protein
MLIPPGNGPRQVPRRWPGPAVATVRAESGLLAPSRLIPEQRLAPDLGDRPDLAVLGDPDPVRLAPAPPEPARPGGWERFTAGRWHLPAILVIQAILSAHLIWANTAYQDEALYLLTGHLEWTHWLYGTPLPRFQTYFSGAPVVYPPVGAAADALGGLALARLLSLCFMLGATTLLHGVTRRIFGRNSAAFAAALFAGAGATQYLGAFATYDAPALALLALATWLGVRAVGANRAATGYLLLVLAGLALALADAAKYAATLFDPAVIAMVVFFAWHHRGRGSAIRAGLITSGTTTAAIASALAVAGPSYWQGIDFTTLTRQPSDAAPVAILTVSLGWAAAVAVLAVIGAVTIRYTCRSRALWALGITLATAVWLAPVEQARISTFTSLFKHVGFGEWFGAIVAGLALASITAAVPKVKAEAALRVSWAAVVTSALFGFLLATNQFASWPNATALVKVLRPMLKGERHSVLAADNGNVIEYYIPQRNLGSRAYFIDTQAQWQSKFSGHGFTYRSPKTGTTISGLKAYNLAIKNGYFTIITLSNYHAWLSADNVIRRDIIRNGDYKLMASIPYIAAGKHNTYQVWAYRGHR